MTTTPNPTDLTAAAATIAVAQGMLDAPDVPPADHWEPVIRALLHTTQALTAEAYAHRGYTLAGPDAADVAPITPLPSAAPLDDLLASRLAAAADALEAALLNVAPTVPGRPATLTAGQHAVISELADLATLARTREWAPPRAS